MALSKENLANNDKKKLTEEITEEAINTVFNNEKLTELFFDFLDDYFDGEENKIDYNDPDFLDDQYGIITGNYIELTDFHDIHPELSFSFPDYLNCRIVSVDGKQYDLEELIAEADEDIKQDSKELLYEIDPLCSDIPYGLEIILQNVEKRFAERIAVEIIDRNQ